MNISEGVMILGHLVQHFEFSFICEFHIIKMV